MGYSARLHIFVFTVFFALATELFSFSAHAQNTRRLEEEALMERARKEKVEEIIRSREQEEEKIREAGLSEKEIEERKLVEVEPNNVLPSDLSNVYALVPYRVRRETWGLNVGLTYSTFTPTNYQSQYATAELESFEALYGSTGAALLELSMSYKYNFALGSIGLEGAYGAYTNDTDDISFGEGELSLQQARLGLRYTMDNITYEPYVAPYVGGGLYVMMFKEDFGGGNSFNGNTSPAPYVYGGVLFQLNWIDKSTAVESYVEAGIENTFLFLEARKYMASSEAIDPDFETGIEFAGGLALEF